MPKEWDELSRTEKAMVEIELNKQVSNYAKRTVEKLEFVAIDNNSEVIETIRFSTESRFDFKWADIDYHFIDSEANRYVIGWVDKKDIFERSHREF